MGTRAKAKLAAFQATALGEGLGIWLNKVGSVAGYVLPAAVAAGAAYAVGGMDGSRNSAVLGAVTWGLGGFAATIFTNTLMKNVNQYRKEGHTHPRLASFRDTMSYFIVPTAVAGWGISQYLTSADAALWLGPAVGAVSASVGIQVLSVRAKRVR